jgi:pyruvate dehydrogenase (quinone)
MLGTDYPYSNFLPGKGSAIQIDERAEVLGRRAPTAFAAAGSIKPSVKLLLNKVAEKQDNSFFERVSRERREWDEKLDRQADLSRSADRIHPQAVARTVGELAAKDAIFVLDTGLNTLWSANYIRQSGSQRIIGSFNNGAVGTAVGQANGIQALDKSRQVIALCGDGGFNMLMSEFLTATHHKLPVKVIVYDNSAFGYKGIDFPNPDYVGLAQACGGHGFKAQKPEELEPAIREALKTDGPAIVDAVVVANEIPNIPDLELELAENYAWAMT